MSDPQEASEETPSTGESAESQAATTIPRPGYWHYTTDGETVQGPLSTETLRELHVCGMVSDDTQVTPEGIEQWQPYHEALSTEAGGITQPDDTSSKTTARPLGGVSASEVRAKAGEVAGDVAGASKLFAIRFLQSDFQKLAVTAEEAEALDSADEAVHGIFARSYLAWRRSLLQISGAMMAVAVLMSLWQLKEFAQTDNPLIVWLVVLTSLGARALACGLAFRAAITWTNVPETRRMTRFSWICLFVVPFLVAMIPVAPFLDDREFTRDDKAAFSLAYGIYLATTLIPLVFGFFSGVVRASLSLKTLLPESPMPGWVAVIISPVFALVFLILLVVSIQSQQLLLSITLGCLALAPLALSINARAMTLPVAPEDLEGGFRRARRLSRLFGVVASGAFILFLLTRFELIDDLNLGVSSMVGFVTGVLSSLLLITVACSDLLLGIFKASFERERELRDSPLHIELSRRLDELGQLGLTDIRAGEIELIEKVRKRSQNDSLKP